MKDFTVTTGTGWIKRFFVELAKASFPLIIDNEVFFSGSNVVRPNQTSGSNGARPSQTQGSNQKPRRINAKVLVPCSRSAVFNFEFAFENCF